MCSFRDNTEKHLEHTKVTKKMKILTFVRSNLLTILIIISVFAGMVAGMMLKRLKEVWTEREIKYIEFPGELFLRMLKALIIPLLVSSIVCAVGTLDLSLSKTIAIRSIIYCTVTTILATLLGMLLAVTIRPGEKVKNNYHRASLSEIKMVLTEDTITDLIRNLFPPNLVQAAMQQSTTKLQQTTIEKHPYYNESDLLTWTPTETYDNNTNILGLVVFAVVLGVAISVMKEKAKPLINFFQSLCDAMMVITGWVIWLSPLGIFFLITGKVVLAKDLGDLLALLGLYFFTVVLGLAIHGFVTLSIIFSIITKKLPFKTLGQLAPVLATAFGTASSFATMPYTIQALDNMGVDPRVTRFLIPVGSATNKNGLAVYEVVAPMFIAQYRGKTFDFGSLVVVGITAIFATIGAAAVPQSGFFAMVMVLSALGLPADDISLVLAVDWLLDRMRTTINVIGNSLGAIIIEHLSKDELKDLAGGDAEPHELEKLTQDINTPV